MVKAAMCVAKQQQQLTGKLVEMEIKTRAALCRNHLICCCLSIMHIYTHTHTNTYAHVRVCVLFIGSPSQNAIL